MTSRRSSGSRRDESSVEPTRSQNITVSCRRSASAGAIRSGEAGSSEPSAAMASSNRRRCPIDVTPSSRRSSPVSRRKTSPSMSLSRNAGIYCSSPRPRSHSTISIGVAHKRQTSGTLLSRPSVLSRLPLRLVAPSGRSGQNYALRDHNTPWARNSLICTLFTPRRPKISALWSKGACFSRASWDSGRIVAQAGARPNRGARLPRGL